MADVKYWISVAGTLLTLGFLIGSLVITLKPSGSQNQGMMAVVLITSFCVSIVGAIIGYILFKGNPDTQLQFLMLFTFILFVSCTSTSIVSAFQLYGLRDSIASNTKEAA
jgi:hypothetical protein